MQYAAENKVDVASNIDKWIQDTPFATADQIDKAITGAGLTQADVNPYLTANTNISDATRYALSHADEMPGAGGLAGMQSNILKVFAAPNLTQAQIDTQQDLYKLSDADIQSPLAHGFQVADTDTAKAINYLNTNPDVQAWVNSSEGKAYVAAHPEFDAKDIAFTHYERYGKGEGRKWEAPAVKTTSTVTGATGNDVITGVTPTGYYGSGPATGVDYRGNTVSIATPGDIIRNPDGTSTVVPNIPGRPAGGFTGMEGVKSAYTAGGGSLGYTAPIPKDPATYYNKMTEDSLDAYNFLMGKGKNLTQRTATAGRPVMRRYDEAVLGRKMTRPVKTTATTKSVTGVPGQPQTYFNEAEYLAANPDVAAELKSGKANFASGYEHYLRNGKAEGRKFTGDYEGYTTAAALADAANTTNTGGGPGNSGPAPGLDASSPANDAPGTTTAKTGGMMGYAMGGGLGSLGSYSDGGRLLKGPGDGMSDNIPAKIGDAQPARLADGEFVVPADVVSHLGNGSTDAGAKQLYKMMDKIRHARTGNKKQGKQINPDKYLP
jgi:hypothetical protein